MKRSIFYLPLIILLLAAVAPLKAQLIQPARLEIGLEDGERYYSAISAEEMGLILYRLNEKESKANKEVFDILCYDHNLEERWTTSIEVENAHFTGYEYKNGKLFFLFQEKRHKTDNFKIISLDVETSLVATYKIENSIPIELTEFTTVDNVMLLGGYTNYRPTVVYFDLDTEKYRVVPGLYSNKSELLEIKTNENNRTFTVLQTERLRNKQHTISTKSFDRNCNPVFEYRLKPDRDRNLLFGRTTTFGDDDALHIAGTYSHGNTRFSRGIFIANIHPDGSQEINYYNYGDLENFFSYMKAKREERMKSRIERRKVKGKKIKLNYRLLVHDVLEQEGANLLLGEAFYPKYSSRPAYSYIPSYHRFNYPSRRSGNESHLEGYQYTHGVLIGFDDKGKLLWDNSFEINDVVSPDLQKYIQVLPYEDYTVLLYMYENVVRTKIIKQEKVLEGKNTDDLITLYEGDEVSDNEYDMGGLNQWYDSWFYAYGVQRIKNSGDIDVEPNRKVFFVNKISYQPPAEGFGGEARINKEEE